MVIFAQAASSSSSPRRMSLAVSSRAFASRLGFFFSPYDPLGVSKSSFPSTSHSASSMISASCIGGTCYVTIEVQVQRGGDILGRHG
jgi:hypothetical protein